MSDFNLTQRISQFNKKAMRVKRKETINRMCKNEYEYLRGQGYSIATIRKFFTSYRKTVLGSLKKGTAKYALFNGTNDDELISSGIAIRGIRVPKEAQMKLQQKQSELMKERSKRDIIGKEKRGENDNKSESDNLPKVANLQKYFDTTFGLLSKDGQKITSYVSLAIGLMAATGRRSTEILKTARFEKIDNDTVMFHGQLKKRKQKGMGYKIRVFGGSDLIIDALAKLRKMKDFSSKTNSQVNATCAKEINKKVKKFFNTCVGVSDLEPHDLRRIYAETCFEIYKAENPNKRHYDRLDSYAYDLGHFDLETGKTEEDSWKVSQSYVKFEINDKGIEYIKSNLL